MAATATSGGLVTSAIERLLNALLEDSTAAREQLGALQGKSIGLRIVGPDVELVLRSDGRALALERAEASSGDATLTGTPIALLEAARRRPSGDLSGSGVGVGGDARVLEDFFRLYALAAPDLEEALSRLCGDVVAHGAFRLAGGLRAWGSRALDALALNAAEYLQEESRALPGRAEAEALYRDIERVRDGVERAAARVERLNRARGRE